MICAEDELGIGESHDGIMVLDPEAVVGTPAKDYLGLATDAVIEIGLTANRVDAASHIGVARDLYAYLKHNNIPCSFNIPDVSAFAEGEGEAIPVEVTAADGSPRYTGTTIKGVLDAGALGEVGNIVPQVEAIVPKVDSVLTSLNSILSNPAINNTLNNIESLTAQLNTTSAQISYLVKNDIPVATDKLIQLEDDLLKVSAQLSEINLSEMVVSLETSLNNMQQITAALNSGEGTAGMLLKDTLLYSRLNDVCNTAISLLEDLKAHPKRYVHFSVFGNKE